MSRSFLIGIAAIAGVAVAPMAMAQDGAIVVTGPRVQSSGEARLGVHPTLEMVSQVTVPTHDLDLRTEYGRSVLDHRVMVAAAQVCSEIQVRAGSSGFGAEPGNDERDCRFDAVNSARAQVSAARWAAG